MMIDPKEFSKGMMKAGYGLLAGAAMTAICVGVSILLSEGKDEDAPSDDVEQDDFTSSDDYDGLEAAMSYDDEVKTSMESLADSKVNEINDGLLHKGGQDFVSATYYLEGLMEDLASVPSSYLSGNVIKMIGQYKEDAVLTADKVSFFVDNYENIIRAWFGVVSDLDESVREETINNGRLSDDFVYHLYR